MGEHHAFGLAFGTGGEQHHSGVLRAAGTMIAGGTRQPTRVGDPPQLVAQRDLLAQVFKIDDAEILQRQHLVGELALFKESARG